MLIPFGYLYLVWQSLRLHHDLGRLRAGLVTFFPIVFIGGFLAMSLTFLSLSLVSGLVFFQLLR